MEMFLDAIYEEAETTEEPLISYSPTKRQS